MHFELDKQQLEMQRAAIQLARSELNSELVERDRKGEFSRKAWAKCAEFGIQGMPIPEKYGGSGADAVTTIAVMEGLGYGCRDQGLLFSINAHMWTNSIPVLLYGTEDQKANYLPGLCNGKLIGANGASEPDAGSDVFAMRTRAIRDGNALGSRQGAGEHVGLTVNDPCRGRAPPSRPRGHPS